MNVKIGIVAIVAAVAAGPAAGWAQPSLKEPSQTSGICVKATGAKYKVVSVKSVGGRLETGQEADIMLSGMGFNNAGGPLLFNHPGNVASDGSHLLLADRNNNRILIWNSLPDGNTPPDMVLGQKDFNSNDAGAGLGQLNWPVAVGVADGKVVVGDTNNDRILIWASFPVKNGQPADIEIKDDKDIPARNVGWPWAVWTNGKTLIVTATAGAKVLIWNTFPAQNNQKADIVLTANGNFGTPRSIASDGKHLVIGDHNAKPNNGRGGNFFWKAFPVGNDQKYDFFVSDLFRMGERRRQAGPQGGDVLWGGMTSDGKLIGIANMLYIWNSFPQNEQDAADLKAGGVPGHLGYDFGGSQSGDGSSAVLAGGRLYISLSNGNKVVGFNGLPTRADQEPDFALGAPDIHSNTFEDNCILTNAVVATDGRSLFAGGTFGKLRLFVWKNLPDESAAKPDFIYELDFAPRAIATHNNMLVVSGDGNVAVWNKIPLNGEMPDMVYRGSIGGTAISEVGAIAFDDKYFYLADDAAGVIYGWEGFPSTAGGPKFSLKVAPKIKSVSSDGRYLAVASGERDLFVYRAGEILSNPNPVRLQAFKFNLPASMLAYQGKMFVADTGFNRVQIWDRTEDALAGKNPDVILGQAKGEDMYRPRPSSKRLFMPARLAFDGSFLWVGEFKFSSRILRFSARRR